MKKLIGVGKYISFYALINILPFGILFLMMPFLFDDPNSFSSIELSILELINIFMVTTMVFFVVCLIGSMILVINHLCRKRDNSNILRYIVKLLIISIVFSMVLSFIYCTIVFINALGIVVMV